MKRILLIAPLTPPYTGNALPVKYIFDHYSETSEVKVVNLAKGSFKSGLNSMKRVMDILRIVKTVRKESKNQDLIYLTIAESFFGNLRDLFIYTVCFSKRRKIVIHLLGGNSMKQILSNRKSPMFWINRFFISRLGAVIVEGMPQKLFFQNVTEAGKIHVIPNFAQKFLFVTPEEIESKFTNPAPINILFLSNLIYGKGHYELVEAFKGLTAEEQQSFRIDFAGGVESPEEKEKFGKLIAPYPQISYWGHVGGEVKTDLFRKAHVFCLPTYYPFEGQPFVIVESYASGCAVITTDHSGISYIFKDGRNGIQVEKKSVDSLKGILEKISAGDYDLKGYARHNLAEAESLYTDERYIKTVNAVFKDILN